jgi:hypothetical protein
MIYRCLEPALVTNVVGADWNFRIYKHHGHGVMFPHVDSCMGVICALTDDSIFACHISSFFQNDMNYPGAFDSLTNLLGVNQVQSAVVFGDIPTWNKMNVRPAWTKQITFISDSCGNGVDAFLDVDTGAFKLMSYKAGRADDDHSNVLVGGNINLYAIAASSRVVC